jgi:type I restriction enzyme S subunit
MMVETRFKKTDIGEIPEEWEVLTFEMLCTPNSIVRGPFGGALKKEIFISSGFKVYEQRNAIYQTLKIGDYYIDKKKYDEMKRFAIKKGDFIVSCSGTIGKIFQIPPLFPAGIINQALLKFEIETKYVNPSFFYYYFSSSLFQYRIIDDTQGGAMKNLVGMDVFRKTIIPIPFMAEQQRIAIVLRDIDMLLSVLSKKIEKKRFIKQGVMQQLLTGEKRLNGFTESWIEEKLGNISLIKTGCRNGNEAVENGKYPFFVRSQTVYRINSYSFDGEAIIIPGEGGIGSIYHYINGKFDYHQRVYKISDFPKNIYAKYIYFYMKQNFGDYATNLSVKATVDSLRLSAFSNFVLYMPPSKAEQIAIATILSDMDAEIEALETKRAKYEQVKQGMMQQLLTGKIRLID